VRWAEWSDELRASPRAQTTAPPKLEALRVVCAGEPASARFGDSETGSVPADKLEIE